MTGYLLVMLALFAFMMIGSVVGVYLAWRFSR